MTQNWIKTPHPHLILLKTASSQAASQRIRGYFGQHCNIKNAKLFDDQKGESWVSLNSDKKSCRECHTSNLSLKQPSVTFSGVKLTSSLLHPSCWFWDLVFTSDKHYTATQMENRFSSLLGEYWILNSLLLYSTISFLPNTNPIPTRYLSIIISKFLWPIRHHPVCTVHFHWAHLVPVMFIHGHFLIYEAYQLISMCRELVLGVQYSSMKWKSSNPALMEHPREGGRY